MRRTCEEGRRLREPAGHNQAPLPRVARALNLPHAVRQARVKQHEPVERRLDRGDLRMRTLIAASSARWMGTMRTAILSQAHTDFFEKVSVQTVDKSAAVPCPSVLLWMCATTHGNRVPTAKERSRDCVQCARTRCFISSPADGSKPGQ